MFTNSSIPYLESSLPNPLCFIPPNGILGSEITTLFTLTIPDSICLDKFSAFVRFSVHILAPKPNSMLLDSYTASFSSSTTVIGATGPKVSSLAIFISGLIFFRIVGL